MKITFYILLILFLSACSSYNAVFDIPANQSLEIDYADYELYSVDLKNKSTKNIEVAVLSKAGSKQVRGFGLGKKASAKVVVEKDSKLVLRNSSSSSVSIALSATPQSVPKANDGRKYVSFTLRNNSTKSIPLIIPTVMNPNLSPLSNSGVDLKIGQEILFKYKGKRYVLLTVDQSIENGAVLDVADLLKKRKKELDV